MKYICPLLLFLQSTHHVTTHASVINLVLEPKPRAALSGENIILNCLVPNGIGSGNYIFRFFRNEREIKQTSQSKWTIKKAKSSNRGMYWCELKRGDRRWVSPEVYISVTGGSLSIQADPPTVFEGDVLILTCRYKYNSWQKMFFKVEFYKDNSMIYSMQMTGRENLLRIKVNSSEHSGSYHCRAYSRQSRRVHVHVHEAFTKPTLRADTETQLFDGQQLKLVCLVEILDPTASLKYEFFKNGQTLNLSADHNHFIMEATRLDDSGIYLCEITTFNNEVKKLSNQVPVLVRQIAVSKPELVIRPGNKLMEGNKASLICAVSTGSTPITYVFYNVSNKELYREESNLTRITYEIGKINRSSEGNYSCSAANEATEPPRHSEFVAVSMIAPVAGALLTCNTNKTVISPRDRLVFHCQFKAGTAVHFDWYLNNQPLESTSDSYQINWDRSELIINSFQRGHGGRYHCVAINSGINERRFNATSNYIDITAAVQSPRTAITASVLSLLLIAALIALFIFKQRNKTQMNASSVSQSQGGTTGNTSQLVSEEPSGSPFQYAVVGAAQNNASGCDQHTYSIVQDPKSAEVDTKRATNLDYSEVTIKMASGTGNCDGASGRKRDIKKGPNDYCVTYATINHGKSAANLQGDHMKEEDDCDANVYENLPRVKEKQEGKA
ncbi:Fc receptor-like protein 2 isoform X2 [Heterodontus francisci]|uniref:Fc receptor-like protein 2 isoform X2 n=1 Tax=Heterodontus francisci TaxID=7792 RepID=UPI00355C578F